MNDFRWNSLHFITRLIVVAAVLRLVADALVAFRELDKVKLGAVPWAEWISATAHAFGYSLAFFGTAATVELLFRIWREIQFLRATGATVANRTAPTPSEPPKPA